MPYKSEAQRRFFHTETASRKGITAAMVREYDEAGRARRNDAAMRYAKVRAGKVAHTK